MILGTLKEQRLVLWDAQKSQATARYHEGARERNRTVEATRNVKSTSREHATHYRDAYPTPNVGHYTKQEDYYGDSYEIENQINFSAESNRNNPHGLQGLLFQESLALIDERIRIFQDIDDRANYLQTLVYVPLPLIQVDNTLTPPPRTYKESTPTKTAKNPQSTLSPS